MLTPVLRTATAADAPVIATLWSQLGSPVPADAAAAYLARCGIDAGPGLMEVVLAEDGAGRPLGTATLLLLTNACHAAKPVAVAENVVVDAAARGGGLGAALMRDLARRAVDAGAYKLMLSSNLRRIDAHAFYRRLGFRQHGCSFLIEPQALAP